MHEQNHSGLANRKHDYGYINSEKALRNLQVFIGVDDHDWHHRMYNCLWQ